MVKEIEFDLKRVRECESTQDLALKALANGAQEGWAVVAEFQRSGRGRQGSRWVAPWGSSLLCSVILEPVAELLPFSPLLAGIAVRDALAALTPLHADLKWPNDVMVRSRKLGGILVEHPKGSAVVVGIGLNLEVPPSGLVEGATALRAEYAAAPPRDVLLKAILRELAAGFHPVGAAGTRWVREAWLARSSMLGSRITFERQGEDLAGTVQDLAEDGALVVRLDNGQTLPLLAGAVRHVRPA